VNLAHIVKGSEGKFAQAAMSGIILGWAYIRYGFVAALLIHWATNYFVFSYANFISQLNLVSIDDAFSHSLMSSLELLFLVSGALSIIILFVSRFYSKKVPAISNCNLSYPCSFCYVSLCFIFTICNTCNI